VIDMDEEAETKSVEDFDGLTVEYAAKKKADSYCSGKVCFFP